MDLNFADLKKEAAATAEDFVTGTLEAAKQATQQASQDLLGGSGSGSTSGAAPLQDDNAHTEHYFSNDQKLAADFDFEHVDPQTFVQRMSAGAKEAQEQLDAKFAQKADDFNDFLGNTAQTFGDFGAKMQQQTSPQAVSDLTRDFMNAERGFFGDGPAAELPKAAPTPAPPAEPTHSAVEEDDLLGGIGHGDGHVKPTAPPAAVETGSSHFFDNLEEDEIVTSSIPKASNADIVSTKDSDTESPSVSYNPSPAKKNPIADALKEQDSDKFISSEDLLGDLKEERTATPEFHVASSTTASADTKSEAPSAPPAQAIPTTDLDADDDDFMHDVMSQHAVPAKFEHSHFEEVKDSKPTPAPAPAPAPTPAPEPTPAPAAAPAAAAPKPAAVSEPVKAAPVPVKDATVAKDTSKGQPNIVSVEEIFYKYGLDAWFKPERLHPRVESLIYWRDVKKSGIVFGAGLVTLLAISCFSVISVFAYLSLLALTGTVAFRIYKTVMQAIQKTNEGHPFKEYLEFDLTLSQEKIQNIAGVAVAHINGFTAELRRLFLVEDIIDSIKFGVILWVMTYIGAWFNGMTLVILAFVSLFTLPKVYENNKQSIDTYLDLVRSKLTEVTDKIKVAIPIGNKKPIETDKDK